MKRTTPKLSSALGAVIAICVVLGWPQGELRAQTSDKLPAVTVVLAGGGAKGFAHLAVLRRLEQDHIKINKIIGTSMGAVIGGLYASGMRVNDIETVIGNLDPAKIALDQVDRTELPHRTRAYQQQYPVGIELGVKDGALSFARGVSDGQKFLGLLQRLTANVPPHSNFDDLKIPFRAVATRYRDGELVSFDQGSLSLAIRASMAAPGAFAPVEIDGETYVDGGLVANLPVEVALREGSDIIVASYLGDTDRPGDNQEAGNALSVANQMLNILVRQNEKRNIALLRQQDILVRPQLQEYGFSSFGSAKKIVQVGEEAVQAQDPQFKALAAMAPWSSVKPDINPTPFNQREINIAAIKVTGNDDVPASFIERSMSRLIGREYLASEVSEQLDDLYASGHFERLNYQLKQMSGSKYVLEVDVLEKTYGPNFLKTSLGFYTESSGTNLFSAGLGFRRPWYTPSGLELSMDVRVGSQTEFALGLFQPLEGAWGMQARAAYTSSELPIYRPDVTEAEKMALTTLRRQELELALTYDLSKKMTAKIGLVANRTRLNVETANTVSYLRADGQLISYGLSDGDWAFTGVNAKFTADQLDSPSFPTKGYLFNISAGEGVTADKHYASFRASGLWAKSYGSHVINLGMNVGSDHILDCPSCAGPTSLEALFLGGFQAMGAYQLGQLSGDRLAHFQGTYMYRLTDGGIFRQPTFLGFVAEAGDAWSYRRELEWKYSGTAFVAVDSKVGDIYFGIASGSGGNRNIFLQLGRRFSIW